MTRRLRIGAGSAWWGDRIAPAAALAEQGRLDFLCFETMAEATVSAAQVRKRRDPDFPGYDTHLEARFRAVLPGCLRNGTRIVSNQGWINPEGAAWRIRALMREAGCANPRVAAVVGGDLTGRIAGLAERVLETGEPLSGLADRIVSAEAYLGAEPIVAALDQGAQVVVTGRVADPSLFLAPMMHAFGWAPDDAARLGQGAGIGHLMECAAQVTGGYFADPGYKDVERPWDLGFPIAEVAPDGSAEIGKLPGTGGAVNRMTVLEQLFYEVHDPARYLTPDVTVDFTGAEIEELGDDRVRVSGIGGQARSDSLKVSIGLRDGFVGEDMIFLAGPGALDRARLAALMLRQRLEAAGFRAEDLRVDLLGLDAIHGPASRAPAGEPPEVALRLAARCASREEAAKIGEAVDGMGVGGVASTGKRVPHQERVREVVGVWSALVPRDAVVPEVRFQ